MTRPLHEFGGWLKFFYVITWINFVMVLISMGIALFSMIKPKAGSPPLETIFIIIRSLLVGFTFIQIAFEIKHQSQSTPHRIYNYIGWYLWASLLASFVLACVQFFLLSMPWVDVLIKFFAVAIGVVLWWYIWTSYFKESRRVLSYYGNNA